MSAITFAKSAKYFFNSNVLILVASHLSAKHNQKHLEKWSNCLKYVTNALGGAFKADHILLTTWGVFLKIPTFCNQKIFLPHQAGHMVRLSTCQRHGFSARCWQGAGKTLQANSHSSHFLPSLVNIKKPFKFFSKWSNFYQQLLQ